MTNEIKKEIVAFIRDYQEMCAKTDCYKCLMNGYHCGLDEAPIDRYRAIAAVEEWRKKRKPKPEVIDKAVDIYTIEVEVERDAVGATRPAKYFAEFAVEELYRYFRLSAQPATVSVLSAKRFALETHREDEDE